MRPELLLLPLAPVYRAVVRLRAALYRRGVLASARAAVPVVSIGNVTFGGTGKTPMVIALVRELVRRGRKPAVLSRGYGRRTSEPVIVVAPAPGIDAAVAGDEPLEIATALPGVPVVVDRDRVEGARRAIACGADILVMDDGFQHLRLRRDLDLVLVDAGDPFGGRRMPPRGRLREPLSALERADAVVLTKLPDDDGKTEGALRREIAAIAPALDVYASAVEIRRVRTPESVLTADALAGQRVLAFAAIARPDAFVDLLERAGAEVVGARFFPDHHPFGAAEVEAIAAAAERADAIAVCTGKDAVKLPRSPAWVVEIALAPVAGWDPLLAALVDGDGGA